MRKQKVRNLEKCAKGGYKKEQRKTVQITVKARYTLFSVGFEQCRTVAVVQENKWRKGWDSNPRSLAGSPVFKTGALNRSATLPCIEQIKYSVGGWDCQGSYFFSRLHFSASMAKANMSTWRASAGLPISST